MSTAFLEHVNVTVTDPKATAQLLCDLFGWRIRWQGDAISGGYSVHVGNDDSYVAVYSQGGTMDAPDRYRTPGALNHIGVVVEDIDATETKVREAGFTPFNHADYEPGRRFYFDGPDMIEIEVVSYA
ncbi:VOC family protein [Nioella nitratireducens]|uniref:VOC family protein n=1 Tax=Nioella nitratireducens TaxID=1287720 RepID=UPI0008FD7400|nr:VOC family protein [Nioella nitratireducens]